MERRFRAGRMDTTASFNRRDFLHLAGAAAAGWPVAGRLRAAESAGRRPNVIVIYSDDHPNSLLGCYGGLPTPHIDRLAAEGVHFTRFYVSTALCAPSRYGLHTGRYASTAGAALREFPPGGPVCVVQQIGDEHNRPPERFALPATLKDAGYATGIVGKWHQGFMGERAGFSKLEDAPADDPRVLEGLRHNFKLAQDAAHAAGYDYTEALYHDNVQPENFPACVRFHNQEWVTWKALQFIEVNRDRPFFLNVCPTLVHYPPPEASLKADRRITALGLDMNVPPDVQPGRESVLKRAEGTGNRHAAGAIWLDDAVGAILKRIADLGLDEQTIVIFASDNGTGGKWSCYEGGVNTAAIARWKGRMPGGRVSDALVQNVDIAPTIFDLCGVQPEAGSDMHGVSLAGHLLGDAPGPRRSVYLEFGYQRAVVADDGLKCLAVRYPDDLRKQVAAGAALNLQGGRDKAGKGSRTDELYDLAADKTEQKNLADDPVRADDLARMRAMLGEYSRRLPHAFGEFAPGTPPGGAQ